MYVKLAAGYDMVRYKKEKRILVDSLFEKTLFASLYVLDAILSPKSDSEYLHHITCVTVTSLTYYHDLPEGF